MDTISFFKNLKPEDWEKPVTELWKVKDVLAHLVGWEREIAQELPKAWENSEDPWFMDTDNFNNFNAEIYEEYKDFSPAQLLAELKEWQNALDEEIERIGEDDIRNSNYSEWVFDEGREPHFEHHINQVRQALI